MNHIILNCGKEIKWRNDVGSDICKFEFVVETWKTFFQASLMQFRFTLFHISFLSQGHGTINHLYHRSKVCSKAFAHFWQCLTRVKDIPLITPLHAIKGGKGRFYHTFDSHLWRASKVTFDTPLPCIKCLSKVWLNMSVICVKGLSKTVANQSLIHIKGMLKVSRGTATRVKGVSNVCQRYCQISSRLLAP